MSEKKDAILALIEGEPLTAAVVAEHIGDTSKNVAAMMCWLRKKGLVENVDGKWKRTDAQSDGGGSLGPARPAPRRRKPVKREEPPAAEAYLARDGSWIVVDGMTVIARVPAEVADAIRRA